jgi:hypothetical protein
MRLSVEVGCNDGVGYDSPRSGDLSIACTAWQARAA